MEASVTLQPKDRVLIVDDEQVIRDIMTDFLGGEGYETVAVTNGKEALDKVMAEHFDLVLVDLKMPVMDGIQLLKEMRSRKLKAPVVMMTGYGTLETAVECMKMGAQDYIQKPFRMSDVLAVIRRTIRQKKIEEENIQLKEIMNLYKISEAMTSSLSLPQILEIILDTIMGELDADAVAIHSKENGEWRVLARKSREELEEKGEDVFGKPNYETILSHFKNSQYLLVKGNDIVGYFLEMPILEGLREFMAIPLVIKAKIIGIACCYAYKAGNRFLEGHARLLTIFASRAAGAIENAQLYHRLQQTLQETIQGLVTALEAKDRYTSGHTKRVTDYAIMLARGLGLESEKVEQIRRAALLHDIGKIGIRLEALNKAESLSQNEYEAFKEHPRQSRQILEPIHFLRDIIPIVEAHHERWDGSGYPLGLRGEEIPLGARILAIADSFDAMTSDRPYRKALSRQMAIKELRENAGTQFDPTLVEVFIRELQKRR
jgi:putative nucleotidyltransferase with HDIG domain